MTLRTNILSAVDTVIDNLTDNVIIPSSRHVVKLVSTTYSGRNKALGRPGTATTTETIIQPISVSLDTQYRYINGIKTFMGDAMIKVSQTITRAQIEGAEYVTIATDGGTAIKFDISNSPGLIDEPGGFFWTAYLLRRHRAA